MSKLDLRAAARLSRAESAGRQPDFAERIATYAVALSLPKGAAVASFWPLKDEADPRALAAALAGLGHSILLPRVEGPSAPLSFRLWCDGDPLTDGAFGVKEPMAATPAGEPGVVLVPLLAFDREGFRLGYGGGYYDRSLAALRARGAVLAIGIAYAGQEVERLPHDPHDERLDMLVAETGIRHFAKVR